MKKAIKIAGLIIVLILALMIILPYLYRDRIAAIAREEINKNLNATVGFERVGISLFRNFPHLSLRLKELSVINKAPFEGDTLVYTPALQLTFDLKSLFRGDAYVVRKIAISSPFIKLLTDKDGNVNWDIIPETQDTASTADQSEETSRMVVRLKQVSITDGQLVYDDKSLNFKTILTGISHQLSGDFTVTNTTLKTHTSAESLTVYYNDLRILENVEAELSTPIQADFDKWIFTFAGSELRLNNFYLIFQGSFEMPDNGDYITDITFSSKKTDFRDFLSLIPAMYATDLSKIKASGTAVLSGKVKGIYNDTLYPGFELNILVNNGWFRYPDLPKSVDNVNLECRITFPESSDFNQLSLELPLMSLSVGGNQISSSFFLKQPLTEKFVKGKIRGVMNLAEVGDFYPLPENEKLKGKITADVSFDGSLSAIEKQNYEAFQLDGSLVLESLNYKSTFLEQPIEIISAVLKFSPRTLDLSKFDLRIGRNDLSASGKLEHFLPYYLYGSTMTGNLNLFSNYLNINDLLSTSPESDKSDDSVSLSTMRIPGNIDFTMSSVFKTLNYGNLTLNNTEGLLIVRNQTLTLEKLKTETSGGTLSLKGSYNTSDPDKPLVRMDIRLDAIDIPQAFQNFGFVNKFAPIAAKTRGNFSAGVQLETLLDQQMTPLIQFMNGSGNLSTSSVTIANLNVFEKLSDLLKLPDLRQILIDPVNLSFELAAGKMIVKPFDAKYKDIHATAGGWIMLDQSIDFDAIMSIPRTKFGEAANQVISNLSAEASRLGIRFTPGDYVNIKIKFTGNMYNPDIKVMPSELSPASLKEELKRQAQDLLEHQKQKLLNQVNQEVEKKKQEARQKADKIIADAERQAARIIEEAQRQADAINKAAQESAAKLKEEAYRQADKLVEEGRKKGPIAEAAARKAAEQTRKEADKKAQQMIAEAREKSDKLVAEAHQQAAKIRSDAQKEAQKLLE